MIRLLMKTPSPVTAAVLRLLLMMLLLLPSGGIARAAGATPPRPLVFAAYYCWYRSPDHPTKPWSYWTYKACETNPLALRERRPGEPPLASAARPLVGFYDSADPLIAEWHVRLARSAGIDAFLLDWWDSHDGNDKAMETGILAAAEKHDFKVALFDERVQFHDRPERHRAMLARALRRYKDNPAYLRIDGRPVVYLYQVAAEPSLAPADFTALRIHVEREAGGPVYWIVDKITHDHEAQRAGHEDRTKRIPAEWLRTPGIDAFAFYGSFSVFRAHRYEDLVGTYRHLARQAHDAGRKMLLPVHPGHDNSRFGEDPYVMPRRDGQTLRDFLRAAGDAGADHVLVTSWNEWPETTVIEPSSSWEDPYLYLKVLAEWRGRPFAVPPLPTRGGPVRR